MTRRDRTGLLALALPATLLLGAMLGRATPSLAPGIAAAGPARVTFSKVGEQRFTVPARITSIHVTAVGASGGHGGGGAAGGRGAVISADIPVTPGTTLIIGVGGAGVSPTQKYAGGGGGSYSAVRLAPSTASGTASSRLIVAGGGGGGGGAGTATSGSAGGAGGDADLGGVASAGNGSGGGGRGGMADVDGAGGVPGGVAGVYSGGGGGAVAKVGSGNGGGGGGGWFGGGGGGAGQNGAGGGGGGGGATWVTPLASGASIGTDTTGRSLVTLTPDPVAGVALPPVAHMVLLGLLGLVIAGCVVLMAAARGRGRAVPPGSNGPRPATAPRSAPSSAPAKEAAREPVAAGSNGRSGSGRSAASRTSADHKNAGA